jgi:hypothetical protein
MKTRLRTIWLRVCSLGILTCPLPGLAVAESSPAPPAGVAFAAADGSLQSVQVGNGPGVGIAVGADGNVVVSGASQGNLAVLLHSRPARPPRTARPAAQSQVRIATAAEMPSVQVGPAGVVIDGNGLRVDTRSGVQVDLNRPDLSVRISEQGLRNFAAAQAAFRLGNYQEALKEISQARREMPDDLNFLQLESLVRFALHDYARAAESARASMAKSAAWDWPTLSSYYPDVSTYARQYGDLRRAAQQNAAAWPLQVLLGFHELMLGHYQPAASALQRAAEIRPDDTLSREIAQALRDRAPPSADMPR